MAELSQIHFFEMTEFTLDLLLKLVVMNFHLVLGHLCRKANRWYFGYLRDPSGSYEREKKLKEDCKGLIREYYLIDRGRPERTTVWKKTIFEFKQSWGPRKQ